MRVEAVTRALCWIAAGGDRLHVPSSSLILADLLSLLQKVKSGIGSPDWNVSMVDIHLRNPLWGCNCSGHAGVMEAR